MFLNLWEVVKIIHDILYFGKYAKLLSPMRLMFGTKVERVNFPLSSVAKMKQWNRCIQNIKDEIK